MDTQTMIITGLAAAFGATGIGTAVVRGIGTYFQKQQADAQKNVEVLIESAKTRDAQLVAELARQNEEDRHARERERADFLASMKDQQVTFRDALDKTVADCVKQREEDRKVRDEQQKVLLRVLTGGKTTPTPMPLPPAAIKRFPPRPSDVERIEDEEGEVTG